MSKVAYWYLACHHIVSRTVSLRECNSGTHFILVNCKVLATQESRQMRIWTKLQALLCETAGFANVVLPTCLYETSASGIYVSLPTVFPRRAMKDQTLVLVIFPEKIQS